MPKKSTASFPLELPELLHNILINLSEPDLVRTMTVNRKWHAEASRLLWKTVVFTDHGSVEQGLKTMKSLTGFAGVCKDWREVRGGSQRKGGWGLGRRRDSLGSVGEVERGKKEENEEEEDQEEIEAGRTKLKSNRGNRQKSGRRFFTTPSLRLITSRISQIISTDLTAARKRTDFFKRTSLPTQNYASLVRTLSIRKVKDPILNKLLESFAPNARYLNTLELYICDFIQNATVMAFVDGGLSPSESATLPPQNNFLTNVSVPGCSYITDEAVTHIAKRCPALEVLDLRACSEITDASLLEVAARCPRLMHINVGRIKDRCNITIKSIAPLAKGTSLRVLGLAGCDITDECMAVLSEYRGGDIERISVNHCPDITNVSLRAFLGKCSKLTVFEMKSCTGLNDWPAIAELARRNVLLSLSENQQAELEEWGAKNGLVIFLKKPYRSKIG